MASFSKVQHEAIDTGFLDLLGQDSNNFAPVEMTDTENTLIQLAAKYIELINQKIEDTDTASSGAMQDAIQPTEIEINGSVFTIGIKAKEYTSYQDEGVNGWAVDRGSRFSFRTKGVDPEGAMVKAIKGWLKREGKSARNIKVGISERERKGKSLQDLSTRQAMSVAYMIKRQGIKPKHFWRDATNEMELYIENELGQALKIDIINNLI